MTKIIKSYTNLHAHKHMPTCQQQFEHSVKGLISMDWSNDQHFN